MTYTPEQIETLCEVMHDAYEEAAQVTGWETQERSRVPWADVPEANKATMREAVRALLSSVAFGENLAQRDRDIAARAWEEGAFTVYRGNDLVAGYLPENPYWFAFIKGENE